MCLRNLAFILFFSCSFLIANAQYEQKTVRGLKSSLDTLDKRYGCYSSFRAELIKPFDQKDFQVRFYQNAFESYQFLIKQASLRIQIDSPFVQLSKGEMTPLKLVSAQSGLPLPFVFVSYCGKIQGINLDNGLLDLSKYTECDSLYLSSPGFASTSISLDMKVPSVIRMEELGLLREFERSALRDYHWITHNTSLGNERVEPNMNFMSLLGEHDPVQAVRMLPGIQGGGENVPGMVLRGAEPEQNLVVINDVPIYKSSHLFGFTSVFSSDVIAHIDIHKDYIPSEFGGRSSGVMSFQTQEGDYFKHSGSGSIGLLSTKGGLHGPILKGRASYHLHFRRSNLDWLLKPLLSSSQLGSFVAGEGLNYSFYDAHMRLDWKIKPQHHIFFTAYQGRDQGLLSFENENQNFPSFFEDSRRRFSWGNRLASLHWHVKDEQGEWRFKTTAYTTSYEMRTGDVYVLNQQYRDSSLYNLNQQFVYRAGISDIGFKSAWQNKYINNRLKLKSGVHFAGHGINLGERDIFNEVNEVVIQDTTLSDQSKFILDGEMYVDALARSKSGKMILNGALLLSSFDLNVPVLLPRWRLRWQADSSNSFFLGQSVQRQFLQALPNSQTNIPMEVWWPSDQNIQPLEQQLFFIGWNFSKAGVRFTTELFYCTQDGLIETEAGANVLAADGPESWIKQGNGTSWGSENLLEVSLEKWRVVFAYAYLRFSRQISGINDGERYRSQFERPHDIKLNFLRKLGKKGLLSLNWCYNSGGMISLPTARYQTDLLGTTVIRDHYTRVNNYRMPAYHRMDVSYSRHKALKFGEQSWQIGLFNLYNQRNPLFVNLIADEDQRVSTQLVGLLPLLPVLYYEIRF